MLYVVLNLAFTFYVELLNRSSMTPLALWMFCSEIIHFFIVEHFGDLKCFVTRNGSVLDILHICLLVYLVFGEGNGNPLQYACLENPRDGSLVSRRLWGRTESDTTDVT